MSVVKKLYNKPSGDRAFGKKIKPWLGGRVTCAEKIIPITSGKKVSIIRGKTIFYV